MSSEAIKFNWICKHTWRRSAKNTAWCLLGCAIGDFGTILFFQITKIPFPVLGTGLPQPIPPQLSCLPLAPRLCVVGLAK